MNNLALKSAADFYLHLRTTLLASMPELAQDPECLLDTLEGETDVANQIASLLRSAVNDEALVDGLKTYANRLSDRKAWLTERAKRKRAIALHYMEELDIKKITVPDMTITRKPVPPHVIIINESIIPDKFMKIRKEPNKTAIKEAIRQGTDVPGCELSNISETVAIKV